MKKIYIVISIILIFAIVICIYLITGTHYINTSKMESFVTETETKASYVYFDKLYYEDITCDLKEVIKHEKNAVVQQVFCIRDNYVYFSYQYVNNDIAHWCLASVSIEGTEYKRIFDEAFEQESMRKYELNVGEQLSKRNGYFYNNKIVITDFSKLIEYDMKEDSSTVYNYNEYEINENEFVWSIDNFSEIDLKTDNTNLVINKFELSNKSPVANEILSLYDRMVWNDLSSTKYFLNDVQIVNDDVYIICSLLNRHGETYTLIFECDIENEEYKYCGYHFTQDVTRHFYVVPIVEN